MGEVITFPDPNTRPQRPLDNTIRSLHGADIVFLDDPQAYYDLEESVRQQMHSLLEGLQGLSKEEIAQTLEQIDSGIENLNQYRSGVPEGIVYNIHALLTEIDAQQQDIAALPHITACLIDTMRDLDRTDPRALGAVALLPMDGKRFYGLAHYRRSSRS